MSTPSSSAVRALALEYKSLQEEPVEGFRVKLLNDDNLFEWEVAIFGPPDTLYQGGYFKVSKEIVFSSLVYVLPLVNVPVSDGHSLVDLWSEKSHFPKSHSCQKQNNNWFVYSALFCSNSLYLFLCSFVVVRHTYACTHNRTKNKPHLGAHFTRVFFYRWLWKRKEWIEMKNRKMKPTKRSNHLNE